MSPLSSRLARVVVAGVVLTLLAPALTAQQKPRARALGVPFDGTPGPLNAITDVAGVEVGHTTIIEGSGPLVPGTGPVRTGVTAILPKGKTWAPVFAGWFAGNGFGEMTGAPWVVEGGVLGGPVMITGTYSVGAVRDAVNSWFAEALEREIPWHQPVVGETSDAFLNDGIGQHVTKAHAFQALNSARAGEVAEGNVGGGTGMVAHGFKGGIGTSSRRVGDSFVVGVLVQANYGTRESLTIAGVPVGREIPDLMPEVKRDADADGPAAKIVNADHEGSVIVVVATDAPLSSRQLDRLASRVPLGLARTGSTSGNTSGDIFIAFSTANTKSWSSDSVTAVRMLTNDRISPLFQATAQATEAAITNALLAAETTTGANDLRIYAMPVDRMLAAMRKYGRLK